MALGVRPQHGLTELRARHKSDEQALLVLEAKDVLRGWGYRTDLWPEVVETPAGRCDADLLVITPDEQVLYVEAEVDPRDAVDQEARHNKWSIRWHVGGGAIYVVTTSLARENDVRQEIRVWKKALGDAIAFAVLYTTNVSSPGNGWHRWEV